MLTTTEVQTPAETETMTEIETSAEAQTTTEVRTIIETRTEIDTPPETIPYTDTQERMVWIVDTGKKYHSNQNCSNMKSPYQISISDATARGYEACKKCYK